MVPGVIALPGVMRPSCRSIQIIGPLIEMPSRWAAISAEPMRTTSMLSLCVRGVFISSSEPAMAMARSRSTRAGSSTIDRLSPCKSTPVANALLCAASSGRGSNLPFTVRRRGTWANNGSTDGAGRRLKTMRATGRSTVHGPAGKSCVSVRQPSAAAAIDRISRKQPWPIRIWRDSGSVCGSRRPPSTKSSTSPSRLRSTSHDCRLCGLGASNAKASARRRGSRSADGGPLQPSTAVAGMASRRGTATAPPTAATITPAPITLM